MPITGFDRGNQRSIPIKGFLLPFQNLRELRETVKLFFCSLKSLRDCPRTSFSAFTVNPAQAGIQIPAHFLDSRLRGNDERVPRKSFLSLAEFLNLTRLRLRGNDVLGLFSDKLPGNFNNRKRS
jgi:hypothetical protein